MVFVNEKWEKFTRKLTESWSRSFKYKFERNPGQNSGHVRWVKGHCLDAPTFNKNGAPLYLNFTELILQKETKFNRT